MTKPLHPRRNVGEPIPHSEWAKDAKSAQLGSAVLAWRTANAIQDYARHHRLTTPNAMNVLLYGGELR